MTPFQADRAETQYVDGASARFAYRRLDPRSGVPLVLASKGQAIPVLSHQFTLSEG